MSELVSRKESPQLIAILNHTAASDRVEKLSREILRNPWSFQNGSLLVAAREEERQAWQEVEELL